MAISGNNDCRRLARAGFVALAPDLYSGKLATSPAEARAAYLGHYAEADEFELAEGFSQLEFTLRSTF